MRVSIPPRAVLFDSDSTPADSSRGIIECVEHALADLGLSVPPAPRILATVGLSLEEAFRELTRDPDAGLAFQFTRLFHEMPNA